MFGETSEKDYCKPIFVKSSHKDNYKQYESNGEKEKKLSVNQYLLINDHRIDRRIWKIQINMNVNFISSRYTGETRTY